MSESKSDRFLFIGTTNTDAAVSKLKAGGVQYVQKRLESGLPNWAKIQTFIEAPHVRGVIAKLTAQNYLAMADPVFRAAATRIFTALSAKPHILFVHEALLNNEEPLDAQDSLDRFDGDTYMHYLLNTNRWTVPDPKVIRDINALIEERDIPVVAYRTNAELSVLASAFIDDNERHLLFRVYVPAGRLYAAEADKLLSLFREWLGQIGNGSVRQDGYATTAGKVYEFFGDDSLATLGLSAQFDTFSRFLDRCIDDPAEAQRILEQLGLDSRSGAPLVARYGKEVRRLHLDLRQARESRILAIKQSLESEVLELSTATECSDQLGSLVESMVPSVGHDSLAYALAPSVLGTPPATQSININQQIIQAAQTTVVQSVQGTVHLGPEARELITLARKFGEARAESLESDVHELEDVGARPSARLTARQRLKAFMVKLGGRVEASALGALQTYLETKLGQLPF